MDNLSSLWVLPALIDLSAGGQGEHWQLAEISTEEVFSFKEVLGCRLLLALILALFGIASNLLLLLGVTEVVHVIFILVLHLIVLNCQVLRVHELSTNEHGRFHLQQATLPLIALKLCQIRSHTEVEGESSAHSLKSLDIRRPNCLHELWEEVVLVVREQFVLSEVRVLGHDAGDAVAASLDARHVHCSIVPAPERGSLFVHNHYAVLVGVGRQFRGVLLNKLGAQLLLLRCNFFRHQCPEVVPLLDILPDYVFNDYLFHLFVGLSLSNRAQC
mmetsp:Transcript_105660/g.182211  ORF Transcript_105660/g.182211 Transcript_105660/m.182211 type:complete len:273 (-) Transcript_105660:318-1136(-)